MINVSAVWQATFSTPKNMEGWTLYRLEYGFEGSVECSIWLPPGFDVITLERLFEKAQESHD